MNPIGFVVFDFESYFGLVDICSCINIEIEYDKMRKCGTVTIYWRNHELSADSFDLVSDEEVEKAKKLLRSVPTINLSQAPADVVVSEQV
jgi:hypothetical protein